MATERKTSCKNCVYQYHGHCHRFPPANGIYLDPRAGLQPWSMWPLVQEQGWCGEHITKANKEELN